MRHGDMTLWLVVINVAVFCLAWAADALLPGDPAEALLPLSGSAMHALTHPWTLLTYMVTHFSLLHLLCNVLWLFWFGRLAENLSSRRHILTAYIAGGICGGLLYIASGASGLLAVSQLVGASASVLCIMAMAAVRTPDMELNLLLLGRVKLKWFALVCILLAFLGGSGNTGGAVAHIGGAATGLLMGLKDRGAFANITRRLRFRASARRARKHIRAKQQSGKTVQTDMSDTDRLDALLDKIRVSGYASLSKDEREELKRLSKTIGK